MTAEKEADLSNIHHLLDELNNQCIDNVVVPGNFLSMEDYRNKTVKELFTICDYYAIGKEAKSHKYNKSQIIQSICDFEHCSSNREITYRRKKLWFYLSELKNDKFMKKFLLC
jgi:hypothetical protein